VNCNVMIPGLETSPRARNMSHESCAVPI